MGKNSSTQTSSNQSYSPTGLADIQSILSRAQQAASTPYQPYGGQLTAGLSGTQQQGIQNINNAYGTAQPYINQAAQYAQQGAAPISAQQINQYTNPYQQDVINSTLANINQTNAAQQQQVVGNAALQGALGGDRVKVAQSQLAGQQALAGNQTLAGLNSQNYQQALAAAQADRAAQGQAAFTYGNLGGAAQNAALQGAGAQLQAGGLEQQTQQAGLSAQYQQYLQQLAFPYQQAQFLAGIGLPAAGMEGGTTTGQSQTQGPQPNIFGQILGGVTAIGSLFNRGGKVQGYDSGGAVNFIDTPSFIPQIKIPFGGSSQQQPMAQMQSAPASQAQPSALDYLKSGIGAGQGLQNISGGLSGMFNGTNAGNIGGTGLEGFGGLYARGGSVRHYDSGGSVNIQPLPPILTPAQMRARWVGQMASNPFSPTAYSLEQQPKGYDDGGAVDDTFDNRFTAMPTASSNNPFQTPLNLPDGSFAGPTPAITGTEAIPDAASHDYSAPTRGYADNINRYGNAISNIESGNNYSEIGPQTNSGDRAYGKYQVMGANIPEWTQAILGKPLTPQEFLNNPQAQDTVFKAKFGTYVDKYGPEGAAKAWFAGEGGMNDPNRRDVLGTSVADYANKFNNAVGSDQLPPGASPTQYQPQSLAPPQDQSVFSRLSGMFGQGNAQPSNPNLPTLFGRPMTDQRMGLLAAGLGMMASPSPYLGTQIGQGGLQGLQMMQAAHQQELQRNQAQQKIDLQAQQMMRQASQFAQQFGLQQQQFGLQQQTQERQARAQEIAALAPVTVGTDIIGRQIKAIRDPKTGSLIPLDPNTGQPRTASPLTGSTTSGALAVPTDIASEYEKQAPGVTNRVEQLYRGEGGVPSQRTNPLDKAAMQLIQVLHPDWNMTMWTAKNKLQQQLSSSSPQSVGGRLNSLRNAFDHLANVSDTAIQKGNYDLGLSPLSTAVNEARSITTSQRDIAARLAREAVTYGGERTKFLTGGEGSEAERSAFLDSLGPNSAAPSQMAGTIEGEYTQLKSALLNQEQQIREQLGDGYLKQHPVVTPEVKQSLLKIEQNLKRLRGDNGASSQQTSMPDANKQALDWASANPNDPRAAEIKKRLGVQ